MFESVTQEWSLLPNMTTERNSCASVSLHLEMNIFGDKFMTNGHISRRIKALWEIVIFGGEEV